MNETLETIKHRGYTIDVRSDYDAESPDQWGDTELFLVGFHDQFSVKRDDIDRNTLRAIACGGKYEDGSEHGEARELMKKYRVFRLDARIYSSADNPHLKLEEELAKSMTLDEAYNEYDSHFFGAVFVSRKEARTTATALKRAKGLLEIWDDYLRGNVYGYTITGPDGEMAGACSGFYGYPYTDMLEEAKSEANAAADARDLKRKEAAEKFEMYGKLYDNGGHTIDRYTIVFDKEVYGMSANPKSPQGFNQSCGSLDKMQLDDNEAVGKIIPLADAPEEVREAIIERVIEAGDSQDYIWDPEVCSSSLGEDGRPMTPGETAHKWDEETGICDECGAGK